MRPLIIPKVRFDSSGVRTGSHPPLLKAVEFSATNWDKLLYALLPLNAVIPAFAALSGGKRYQARLNFYPSVEFLAAIEGVTFEEAWSARHNGRPLDPTYTVEGPTLPPARLRHLVWAMCRMSRRCAQSPTFASAPRRKNHRAGLDMQVLSCLL